MNANTKILHAAYVAAHVEVCGSEFGPAAAEDALYGAQTRRLAREEHGLQAGTWVLVWPRGYEPGAVGTSPTRRYVAWHPTCGMGLLRLPASALDL